MGRPWILSVPDVWDFFGYGRIMPPKVFGAPTKGSEFFGILYILVIIWAWRKVSSICFPRQVQGCMEKILPRTKLFQWHTIMAVMVLYQIIKVLLKLFMFDWLDGGLKLDPSKQKFQVPPPILTLATYSPFACMTAIVVLGIHLTFMTISKNRIDVVDESTGELIRRHMKWFWQMDVMIILQLLPAWFNLMPLCAFLRIWQVISGTTNPHAGLEAYISMFRGCLSMGVLVEYASIFAFCKLLLSYFDEMANHEDSTAHMTMEQKLSEKRRWKLRSESTFFFRGRTGMYWMLRVGAYLCVFSGMFNAFMEIVRLISYLNLPKERPEDLCNTIGIFDYYRHVFCSVSSMKPKVDSVSSAMMILLTITMMFACKTQGAITRRLPGANMKFNGGKIIVMLAQIQGKLLVPGSFLSVDYEKATVFGAISQINFPGVTIHGWNGYITSLLHVSLLQYEILFVSILQYFIWRDEPLTNRFYNNEKSAQLDKSLLGNQNIHEQSV